MEVGDVNQDIFDHIIAVRGNGVQSSHPISGAPHGEAGARGWWQTMFESRTEPLAPRHVFLRRAVKFLGLAGWVIGAALAIGVLGYHSIAGFGWIDSLLNASMILGGMGPVGELSSNAAKVFASLYALFSGLVFISVIGIVLAPAAHRALHRFHLNEDDRES